MKRIWRASALIAVAVSVAMTAGACTDSLALNRKETDIPACSERTAQRVQDLSAHKRATCDASGISFSFPDGHSMTAPAIGASSTDQLNGGKTVKSGTSYELANLGVYGIVAGQENNATGKTQWWGSPDGVSKEKGPFYTGGLR